jgi:chromosome segregation ATPase
MNRTIPPDIAQRLAQLEAENQKLEQSLHDESIKRISANALVGKLEAELKDCNSSLADGKQLCQGYQDLLDKARAELAAAKATMQEAIDEIQIIQRMRNDVPIWVTLRVRACCDLLTPPDKPVRAKTNERKE